MQDLLLLGGSAAKGFGAKEEEGSLELAFIAVEMAMPYQCRECVKRPECPKKGADEFCLDWEYSVTD
ncbi:hypothetical protein [Microbulbifer sp. TYP-18]|uniref:hypothetical protein n=1 Tax=Microbulbifer sp. TYP-18 TaxID=3230024 RepID=UPI0034C6625F